MRLMICDLGGRASRRSQIANQKSQILVYRVLILLVITAALLSAGAQHQPIPQPRPAVPAVSFTFAWPSVEPHRYVIVIDSGGKGAYQSWTADSTAAQPAGEDDSYEQKFAASPAARDRVFALASQLKYFNGDFDFRKRPIAFTGDKTLAYADPDQHYETRYNWSENPGIEELTSFFQGIAETVESGRRLQRLRRFDRLGLDEELKSLEHAAVEHRASELQIIAPILLEIAEDSAVLNIARQRARHILQLAGANAR